MPWPLFGSKKFVKISNMKKKEVDPFRKEFYVVLVIKGEKMTKLFIVVINCGSHFRKILRKSLSSFSDFNARDVHAGPMVLAKY